MVAPAGGGLRRPPAPPQGAVAGAVSTRKLIIAALLTGLAILVAFAVQVTLAAR